MLKYIRINVNMHQRVDWRLKNIGIRMHQRMDWRVKNHIGIKMHHGWISSKTFLKKHIGIRMHQRMEFSKNRC